MRRMRMHRAARKRLKSTARFIAVTGSSGKSTTVALLAHILGGHDCVRSQSVDNTINPLIRTLMQHRKKERFVVAELGVGAKGNMSPMANMLRPDMAIVTMIGIEHYSAFRGHDGVALEKGALLDALKPDGLAVLNGDDPYVIEMAKRSPAPVVTFGCDNTDVDYLIRDVHAAFPALLSFTIMGRGRQLTLKTQFPGGHFWMPVAAAVVAALELGVPIDIIRAQVATFLPVDGRCSVVRTPNGPNFILDTAKAPNGTLGLAFDMLTNADAPRKRVVLGVISDYPGSSSRHYRRAWQTIRQTADQAIFLGRDISSVKPLDQDVDDGRIIGFATPKEAFDYIKSTAVPDELILLKGSSNLHLERIALAFNQPILCWEATCRMGGQCFTCLGRARPFNRKTLKRDQKLHRLAFWRSR
jgi:UDP-N-acetylmuramoyl-tripeptide--D-alanyl-D-alanine ligase